MQIRILAFGIAKDIVGGSELDFEVQKDVTVAGLKQALSRQFVDFEKLASLAIAVNGEYVQDSLPLSEMDEIVLIPPVSGG